MTANKPMTGEQLDELMTVAVNIQRDSEKANDRLSTMFAYAVQVAVLELHRVRNDAARLAAENAGLKHAMAVTLEHVSVTDVGRAGVAAMIINDALHHSEIPATDAFLDELESKDKRVAELEVPTHELKMAHLINKFYERYPPDEFKKRYGAERGFGLFHGWSRIAVLR